MKRAIRKLAIVSGAGALALSGVACENGTDADDPIDDEIREDTGDTDLDDADDGLDDDLDDDDGLDDDPDDDDDM